MKSLELEPELIEVKKEEEKDDLQKYIDQTYNKLDEKCDLIIEKIKRRKPRKKKSTDA